MADTQLIADGYLMILGIKRGETAARLAAREAGVDISPKALAVIRAAQPDAGGATDDLDTVDPLEATKEQIKREGPYYPAGEDSYPVGTHFIGLLGGLIEGIEYDGASTGHYYKIQMGRPDSAPLNQNTAALAVLYRVSNLIRTLTEGEREDLFARMIPGEMPSISAYIVKDHAEVAWETIVRADGSEKGEYVYSTLDDLELAVAKATGRMASQLAIVKKSAVLLENERYPSKFTVYWPAWDGRLFPRQMTETDEEFYSDFPAASDFPMREEMPAAPLDAPAPAKVDPFASFAEPATAPAPLDPLEEKFLVPNGF